MANSRLVGTVSFLVRYNAVRQSFPLFQTGKKINTKAEKRTATVTENVPISSYKPALECILCSVGYHRVVDMGCSSNRRVVLLVRLPLFWSRPVNRGVSESLIIVDLLNVN